MTIKLDNLVDWRVLEGKSLSFVAPDYDKFRPRRVRLYLNSEVGCNWYVRFHRLPILNMAEYQLGHEAKFGAPIAHERFLAHAPVGLETIEFTYAGDFDLMPYEPTGEILYWTSEAEEFWTEGDGETFSTIYERQPRNEALEWVQFQAAQNELRREKAMRAEIAALRAEFGANNVGETGIHGGEAAEHKEPETGVQPTGNKTKAARPAKQAVTGKPGVQGEANANGGDNGQAEGDPA